MCLLTRSACSGKKSEVLPVPLGF